MKKFIYFLTLLVLIAGCAGNQEKKVLKLAHGLDVSHPVHKGMENLAERLAEKSEGKLTIKIYPSGQLGNERECLELLQIGALAMTKVSSGVLENFVPDFKVLGLPYLFQNKDHLFGVLNGPIGQELLAKGQDYRFRGLCFYDAGYRSFYTKERPIYEPKDLEGLKIRVMKSVTAVNMVDQLGGSPTPVSFGELYTALQQGVVDGAENNPPSFYSSRHYEVCKYYTLDEHTALPDVLLVSLDWWKSLTDQEQSWLKEAAMESVGFQMKVWEESEQHSLEEVQKAGVEIIRPDKSTFSNQVGPLYEAYKDQPEQYKLIQRIKDYAAKN
ncbi:TRAP transporter substrate-binding protein [Marinoscillum furvescens]|uniref:Tripartite ATP-independent transporter DctP family solute receptor n=1 Tax=Marinoscillum furvescens DSM 4134 TaxID=1122208 RepID=A0A3D9L0V9_MARFU|nr:TRAP transporter substrate-binding protein [Marinoscillum furvescens]RED97395.1 tripartite ATP-independent transporter DctP family solute receptor [Marinoscillum furvescens DSM 4134]